MRAERAAFALLFVVDLAEGERVRIPGDAARCPVRLVALALPSLMDDAVRTAVRVLVVWRRVAGVLCDVVVAGGA